MTACRQQTCRTTPGTQRPHVSFVTFLLLSHSFVFHLFAPLNCSAPSFSVLRQYSCTRPLNNIWEAHADTLQREKAHFEPNRQVKSATVSDRNVAEETDKGVPVFPHFTFQARVWTSRRASTKSESDLTTAASMKPERVTKTAKSEKKNTEG